MTTPAFLPTVEAVAQQIRDAGYQPIVSDSQIETIMSVQGQTGISPYSYMLFLAQGRDPYQLLAKHGDYFRDAIIAIDNAINFGRVYLINNYATYPFPMNDIEPAVIEAAIGAPVWSTRPDTWDLEQVGKIAQQLGLSIPALRLLWGWGALNSGSLVERTTVLIACLRAAEVLTQLVVQTFDGEKPFQPIIGDDEPVSEPTPA